jgi:hypothetical protein
MPVDKAKQEAARGLGDHVAKEVEALTSESFEVDKIVITAKRGDKVIERSVVTGKVG